MRTRIIENPKKIKIAILSSSTIKGMKKVLTEECSISGILPEIYIGEYNNYAQEIIKEDSALYKFFPDIVIVFVDTQALFGDAYFHLQDEKQFSGEARRELIETQFEKINSLIKTLSERTSAKTVFHNFEVPYYSPLGILENKQEFGFQESIEELNKKLRDKFKIDKKVFIFDYNSFCSKIGKNQLRDEKMYYLADMKIDLKHLPDLAREYLSYIKSFLFLTKKCLVLDLDNTLWGGIVGEDGFENIKLGPTPEGRPFMEFQQYILNLFHSGVILAINSNNNYEDAIKVINEHPYMRLREGHFASIQINWNDKISNMREIAKQLNIGLDSLVFIDDSRVNGEIIEQSLPEVLVVHLPKDTALYRKTLIGINDFNTLEITEEDKKRGEMYIAQKERKEFQETSGNIDEYLKKLNTVVTLEKANDFTIPRIAQLTQKTNQFNMTAKIYFEENIKGFLKSNNYFIISAQVEDKFGDNGITGVAIIKKDLKQWEIDTFLLSCRVIGRAIEKVMLACIVGEAKKEGVETLVGRFISTAKNAPARDFYKNNGFESLEAGKAKVSDRKEIFQGQSQRWGLDIKNIQISYPEFIKVLKKWTD